MNKYFEITDLESGIVIKRIDVSDKSIPAIEKIEDGLYNRVNLYRYEIDINVVDYPLPCGSLS